MFVRCLALMGLFVVATTADAAPSDPSLASASVAGCHADRTLVRHLWQRGYFEVPAPVQPAMLEAADGDRDGGTAQLVHALSVLPAASRARWRQLAFATAVSLGRTATAKVLLDRGAAVDASTPMPPAFIYKSSMYTTRTARFLHAPRARYVAAPNAGVFDAFSPVIAIFSAIRCHDLSTVRMLLDYGSDPNLAYPRFPTTLPLSMAVMSGSPRITRTLLDRGANPCVVDAAFAAAAVEHGRHRSTIAGIGARIGLPAGLVGRLVCHAPGQPQVAPAETRPGSASAAKPDAAAAVGGTWRVEGSLGVRGSGARLWEPTQVAPQASDRGSAGPNGALNRASRVLASWRGQCLA